ncbi:hypothetical protein GCM10023074_61580 [Microbispora amethystogenes]|uniref:Uncharacterized protein n=1 Tax=Microbispora amethystogenes TaxID=1427754 RepID=A0ABQ4FJK0_9ACTN|nr:hypothetical protein Mam01_51360 [Microbispora amethystogenes]
MRKVIANEWMTLDGVVQSPSYADEDVTGGFRHGGWHTRYFDELSMTWVIENVRGAGGYRIRPQCSGLQFRPGVKRTCPRSGAGQADPPPTSSCVQRAQTGRSCCSMYWRRTRIGAPPTLPAK